jgi:hypothetical protein
MNKEYLNFTIQTEQAHVTNDSERGETLYRLFRKDDGREVGFFRWYNSECKFKFMFTGGYIVCDKGYLYELLDIICTLTEQKNNPDGKEV